MIDVAAHGLFGLGALLAPSLLGGAIASAGAPTPAQEGELVALVEDATLRSWPTLVELTREFEARHGVTVKLVDLSGAAGSKDKLKFLLAGEVPLDLARVDVTELAAFVADGALVDLEPYFAADEAWRPEEWFPGPLDACRDPAGHLVGLPSTFTPYVMYVNRALLAREGIAPPAPDWTWADMERIARAATRDLDGDGVLDSRDQWGVSITQWLQALAPWVWQAGAEFLAADGQRATLDSPEFIEVLTFLHRLLYVDRIASNDATFAAQMEQGLFQAGRCALYGPVGYWETYRFAALPFEWDVVPLPRHRRAATAIAMSVYVVPRTSRRPALAQRFLREVLGGEAYQRRMAEIGNGVPGLVSAARSTAFLDPSRPPASAHVFLEVLEHARFLPPSANWGKLESVVQAELEGVLLTGRIAPAAAAAAMDSKADQYLARVAERGARPRLSRWALPLTVLAAVAGFLGLTRFGARRGEAFRRSDRRAARWMLAPWAIGFVTFLLAPMAVSLTMSFTEWSPLRPLSDARFAGLDNWQRLAHDPTFAASLRATSVYVACAVPLQLCAALALALLLRRGGRATGVARTLCYVPAIVSPVIVAAVWRGLLRKDDGPLNGALAWIGVDGPGWLTDPGWVVPSFVVLSVWTCGAQMLVFLAALQSVDQGLEDAARVDGAGAWGRVRHVLLPALAPVILFNALTGAIAAAQVFAQPYVMTGGGPGDASRFLALYLYEAGFRHLEFGYASVLAWVLALLLGALALVMLGLARRFVPHALGAAPSPASSRGARS
ncbi:MAG: extracellular solute-binding protein [Planctomycetota bacterium]